MRNKRVLFNSSAEAIACRYEKVRQPYTFNFINNAHNAYFVVKECDMTRVFMAIICSCLAFLAACNKDTIDPFDAGYGIKAKLNGDYVELENVTAGENHPISDWDNDTNAKKVRVVKRNWQPMTVKENFVTSIHELTNDGRQASREIRIAKCE